VIRRFIEQQNVGRTHELPRQAKSSAFATAQLLQRLGARFFGVEPKTLKHRVHPWGKRVASLAIESLEIPIVPRQHLRGSGFPDLCELGALLRQGVLERQQIREFSRSSLPDSLCAPEIAMLFQKRHPQAGLLRHSTFNKLLDSGDHSEKRGLPASIAPKDCPTVAFADRERHTFEYPRSAKLDTGIRN
jgi:hypothetical protein